MATHRFGGDWTSEKLERVRRYVREYTKVFTKNVRARNLTTIYLDAFAGTGYRSDSRQSLDEGPFLDAFEDAEGDSLRQGSARIALEVEPPFAQYVFIEKHAGRVEELERLKQDFPSRASRITVVHAEANTFLHAWCRSTNWRTHRAVVFLDPYGMQVDWSLIQVLGATKAVDLWLLFPLGVAVGRLLTKGQPPPPRWADALTRLFGTPAWRDEFYSKKEESTLLGTQVTHEKDADFDRIAQFFVNRLKTVFARVAENPLPLRNSKNTPLYLLCFAAANPEKSEIAVRIAQYILKG